jgi:DNA-binding helix-hairpin-helix protein with protein kinase domain
MEATTGIDLFPFVVQGSVVAPGIDLTTLWRQIDALSSPGPAPEIQIVARPPSAQALEVAESFRRANIIAFSVALTLGAAAIFGGFQGPVALVLLFGALLSFFGARRWLDKSSDVYKFRGAQAAAESTWDQARKQWTERCGSKAFDDKMQEVLRVRQSLDRIPALRISKLDQLRTQVRQAQLIRFLDKHRIEDAQLDGIGPGRKRTLQSYSVETAADLISPISVPGFGDVLKGTLYAWRQSIERRFVFNPATGVDPRDVEKVEQDILKERRKLEQGARAAHAELSHLRTRIITTRTQMRGPVEAAYRAHLQAAADYKAVGGK